MNENKSMICTKQNIFSKFINIFKNLFKKTIDEPKENNKKIENKKTKEEILEIYEKAKKDEYDITTLNDEEMDMLNKLIDAEIEIKKKKIDELMTEIKMREYELSNLKKKIQN